MLMWQPENEGNNIENRILNFDFQILLKYSACDFKEDNPHSLIDIRYLKID
jgi:hypothetical protein